MPIELITDPSLIEPEDVLDLYHEEEFWEDRSVDQVDRALHGTDIFLGLWASETEELVAAARVITDFAFYAHVQDVIVAEDRRGAGLGTRLMEAVASRPELENVELVYVECTPELVPFYERCGFMVRDIGVDFETLVLRRDDW